MTRPAGATGGPWQGPAIEIKGVGKAFGRMLALRGLDLELGLGEVLTVLGPNGSGKTTLIKVVATLMRPDSGIVRVAGLDSARAGQLVRRAIGVVTHDPLLYDELTGYENLRFAGRMFGVDRLGERIESVAGQLGVTAKLHQRAGTLSHGLRKRMSIARALLHDPLVLLMDEPDSGLDPEALAMLDKVIREWERRGRSVLMTTHVLERGLAPGRRLAFLSRGRIAHQESVDASTDVTSLRDIYFHHTGVEA